MEGQGVKAFTSIRECVGLDLTHGLHRGAARCCRRAGLVSSLCYLGCA